MPRNATLRREPLFPKVLKVVFELQPHRRFPHTQGAHIFSLVTHPDDPRHTAIGVFDLQRFARGFILITHAEDDIESGEGLGRGDRLRVVVGDRTHGSLIEQHLQIRFLFGKRIGQWYLSWPWKRSGRPRR